MGLLSDLISLPEVINAVELLDVDVLDFEHLELDDGRDLLVAVVTGAKADKVALTLEQLRSCSRPATADAPAVAY